MLKCELCEVCRKFNDKLCLMQNYRPAFFEGMTNTCYLTFKVHAATDMHKQAMELEAKEVPSSLKEYAPIARAMAQAKLSKAAS